MCYFSNLFHQLHFYLFFPLPSFIHPFFSLPWLIPSPRQINLPPSPLLCSPCLHPPSLLSHATIFIFSDLTSIWASRRPPISPSPRPTYSFQGAQSIDSPTPSDYHAVSFRRRPRCVCECVCGWTRCDGVSIASRLGQAELFGWGLWGGGHYAYRVTFGWRAGGWLGVCVCVLWVITMWFAHSANKLPLQTERNPILCDDALLIWCADGRVMDVTGAKHIYSDVILKSQPFILLVTIWTPCNVNL